MKHERSVRIMHLGIVISVLFQMFSEKLIGFPEPGQQRSQMDSLYLGLHEAIGSIALILVCVYLIIALDNIAGRERLFPWLNLSGRKSLWLQICTDIPGWFRGKLSKDDESNFIAGSVHGLGIMLALFLGLTGTMLFMGFGPQGNITAAIKPILTAHSLMADILWIFVIGHAGMALAHHIKGHETLREMFRVGKKKG